MDHHHVNISSSSISCGVLELSRMESDFDKVLYAICTYLYHPSRGSPAAFLIWSDLVGESNGNLFADKLWHMFEDIEGGKDPLLLSDSADNPKTGNCISVWLWRICHEELKEWYVAERVKRAKKV